jgi:hypothetical protein
MIDLATLPQLHGTRSLHSEVVFTGKRLSGHAFLSPDGGHVAQTSNGFSGKLDVVEFASGRSTPGVPRRNECLEVRWSPRGSRLLFADGKGLHCTDIASGEVHAIDAPTTLKAVQFSPDETHVAVIGTYNQKHGVKGWLQPSYQGRLHLVDARTGALERTIELGAGESWSQPAWTNEGHALATISDQHVLNLVDLDSGNIKRVDTPNGLSVQPVGAELLVEGPSQFNLFNPQSLQMSDAFHIQNHDLSVGGATLAARAPDGRYYVIDASQRKTLFTLEGRGPVKISPNGGMVAFAQYLQGDCLEDNSSTNLQLLDREGRMVGSSKQPGRLWPSFTHDGTKLQWFHHRYSPLQVCSLDVPQST